MGARGVEKSVIRGHGLLALTFPIGADKTGQLGFEIGPEARAAGRFGIEPVDKVAIAPGTGRTHAHQQAHCHEAHAAAHPVMRHQSKTPLTKIIVHRLCKLQ